jgi:hypothetical protein
VLAGIAKDGTNEGARVAAAVALLDRGWGSRRKRSLGLKVKAAFASWSGTSGRDKPLEAKVIDATPVRHEGGDGE